MQAILYGKASPAAACSASYISPDEAPQACEDFDKGAARRFVIDPHAQIAA